MKRGFTLIELLGVILIMSLISAIVVPMVNSIIKTGEEKTYEATKDTIISAAKNWLTDNKELLEVDSITLTLSDLKEQSYLDFDIKNPVTGECLANTMEVTITKSGKKYSYAIKDDKLVDGTSADCDALGHAPAIYLLGDNPLDIEMNTTFIDPGATATDADGNSITSSISKTGTIDTSMLASNLEYIYTIVSNGITKSKTRIINVVDTTDPVITGATDTTLYTTDTTFNVMTGVSATDNSGETITINTTSDLTLEVEGTYTVTYTATDSSGNTASVTRTITITILPSYTVYPNGNIIYFNPVSGLKCDLADYTANTGASNNGTKIGCMKWYTFNDSATSSTVNMILDHNTTANNVAWNSTGSNAGGMNEVATALTSDTSTWNSALNARLITATEVATITDNSSWTTSSNIFYFASKTNTPLETCKSQTLTLTGCTYRWLYDRTSTNSATTYGALNNASGETNGYWTSSAHASDSTRAWDVYKSGTLNSGSVSGTGVGVRPVITVSKSVILPVYDTTDPVITGATDTILYTTDATFNIMTGVSVTDDSSETITINTTSNLTLGVAGTYTVIYTATDSSGNTASVTRTITILPPYTVYPNGNIIYFNPVSGLKCDLAAYTANTGASNNGTRIGCMKWYTFNDSATSSTVNMILDHNTTALVAWNSTGSNTGGMKEVATALTTDTSTWNSALNARLITAPEVATITEYAGWTISPIYYYFTSKTSTQIATCTSPTLTGCTYRWLYDRTATDATTYGALNNASSLTYGYWTSSAHDISSAVAWGVYRSGNLGNGTVGDACRGVRPVITVSKSVIS